MPFIPFREFSNGPKIFLQLILVLRASCGNLEMPLTTYHTDGNTRFSYKLYTPELSTAMQTNPFCAGTLPYRCPKRTTATQWQV